MRPTLAFVAILVFSAGAVAAAPKSSSDFLTDAMKGDNSEIKLGLLAQSRATDQKVRDFGTMLVRDHRQAKIAVTDAASASGVTPTDDPTPEALQENTKLNGMSGPNFDREFVRYMVADHRKDIQEFEEQAKSSNKTRTLAMQQLPTLRKHLQTALALAK